MARTRTRFRPKDGPEMQAIHARWAVDVGALRQAHAEFQQDLRRQREEFNFKGRLAVIEGRVNKEIAEYEARVQEERDRRLKKPFAADAQSSVAAK